jgi:hypothetical protein
VETEGLQMTSQYGVYALLAGLARLYARMCIRTPTRSDTHVHARTRKHVHTGQYVILIAFPHQQWFRERAPVLRYTYIACLVNLSSRWRSAVSFTPRPVYPRGRRLRKRFSRRLYWPQRRLGWLGEDLNLCTCRVSNHYFSHVQLVV